MQRIVLPLASAITAFMPAIAHAAAEAPMETVSSRGVAGFVALLVALIIVYVWFTARATKRERAETARQAAAAAAVKK
jgi:heme/copper-type cytochrome/quinol oxidase subunit 2